MMAAFQLISLIEWADDLMKLVLGAQLAVGRGLVDYLVEVLGWKLSPVAFYH